MSGMCCPGCDDRKRQCVGLLVGHALDDLEAERIGIVEVLQLVAEQAWMDGMRQALGDQPRPGCGHLV